MRLLMLAVFVVCSWPSVASAFHTGSTFADVPGAGGAGRVYYIGTALERGWDCTMCHTQAPGLIRVRVDVSPSDLFESFRFRPGDRYDFTVRLVGEHLGAGQSNFNGAVMAFADPAGLYQGSFSGFSPEDFFSGSSGRVLASSDRVPGNTSWSFSWTAPDAPEVTSVGLYLGVVDGNGANAEAGVTLTDPFGDDVFIGTVQLAREGSAATVHVPHRRLGPGRLELAPRAGPRPPPAPPNEVAPPAAPLLASKLDWPPRWWLGLVGILLLLGATVLRRLRPSRALT